MLSHLQVKIIMKKRTLTAHRASQHLVTLLTVASDTGVKRTLLLLMQALLFLEMHITV